jgi:hypothetical protein
MFRVVLPPVIRSAYICIYSIWYLSHRYCYLPPSWKSWNRFECTVGGVMISPSQRPLPKNKQHSQETDIQAPGGIRTRSPRKQAAALPNEITAWIFTIADTFTLTQQTIRNRPLGTELRRTPVLIHAGRSDAVLKENASTLHTETATALKGLTLNTRQNRAHPSCHLNFPAKLPWQVTLQDFISLHYPHINPLA